MARNVWDEPIDKNIPWDGNEETNNLPVRGSRVEEFLKGSLNSKIGVLFYDTTNNRYLAFADEEERDKYIADPTQTDLVLGTFDAPFNYTAEINLASKTYNAVFIGSSGHYIDFTFDVKNKQGASTGESVIVKYTFMRGSNKREVSEIKPFGSAVHFNIDKYLAEGTNTIIVSVTGQNTLAATSVAITYEVVNLQLNDMLDISKVYDLASGTAQLEIPYSISGYGTKIVEWYIDGKMLDYVRAEDEIVESNTTRTKHITLSNLSQGVHSLQFRAYTTVNGELFYTSTLYRDIIVYTGVKSDMIIAIATSIPSEYGIIGSDGKVALYDMVQYVPYTLRFATYSPSNTSNVEVKVKVDNSVKATINSNNGIENSVVIIPTTSGTKSVEIAAGNTEYEIDAEVAPTTMNIQEITNGLVIDFVASEKTNNSSDRDVWEYGDYKGTLSGFAWNNASGWVNNRLEMTSGATFEINYAPLGNTPTSLGKTVEIEWSTKNVKDDNAIICDLRNNNGVGIVIYATKVSMTSADGVTIETEYKSDENVRIAFVINRSTGSTYQRMSFIYANGILSRGDKWALTDSYTSDALLKLQATEGAEVSLKSIRIYDDALSSDNILNNYILYRDTVEEMMEVYDRNDVYEENRDIFSPSKMSSRLPVMIVTGDIPTLENTSDKDTQITVDIEYTNLQDPSRSFKMVGAAMRPQGTSSMGYPKKNFRIYTQKLDTTVVYDAAGNVITDKLYSFKQGAQPVNCWCLKADYAESSGTHNTGIARLWNEALYNAQIDGEYKLRTEAQRIAAASGYEYDVRTTIDGFPILLFYRPSANDDVIFIGKYNFNNDKSTESVFGFKGIPNFDNTHMQCWEVLNNGNPLALFATTENFDTMWSEAFESRYPDTKTPDITGLKAFAQWMSTVSQANFATEKWAHMDVYKMAAYWVYLMRHAGADQFVKNAMFTSEDGEHFYYILYDNDTINGLINTGHLTIRPTDTRQTIDASGSYVFAGHDSRLWNMLEADEEFINIVAKVDNALYSAGISYDNTIRIFDEEQADKWVEKVYNQDATYKYISPYVDKGIDNLFMLQGKRDLHRRWWLAKRFAIYDAKYVSGQYKSLSVELKCINGTPAGQEFTVTAGYPIDYGYGINNLPRKFGVPLEIGESYTFSTSEVVNLGDPIRIYGAPNIAELDFSKMADRLAVVTISNVYEKALGTRLTKLVVGSPTANNLQVNEISGLRQAFMLDYLDIQGMQALTSLDLSAQLYFKTLKAHNSSIASVTFAKGAPVERLELPSSMRVLSLEQLPLLDSSNIVMENMANVQYMSIRNCPNVSDDFSFVYSWYSAKTAPDAQCSLVADNIIWENVDRKHFEHLANLKANGGTLDLKGKVSIPNATLTSIRQLKAIFGETAFYPDSDFYIEVPPVIEISASKNSIWENESLQLEYELYPVLEGNVVFSLVNGRNGCNINTSTGLITTTETALDTSTITARATFTSTDGKVVIRDDFDIEVKRRIYPASINIIGSVDPYESQTYTWATTTENVNGDYDVSWDLQGGLANYFSIISSDNSKCILEIDGTAPDSKSGILIATIKRRFDGVTVSSATLTLNHIVLWPGNVAIVGDDNPIDDLEYTWQHSSLVVTGDYYATWVLDGEITSYLSIASSDTMDCVLRIDRMPMEQIGGRLILTVYKYYNDEVIASTFRSLSAYKEGVIITDWSNAPIQKALYDAGLVANATYTLKSEAEAITANQIQTGTSSARTSIFYSYRETITNFDEFAYFTNVKSIKAYTFGSLSKLESITIPNNVTDFGNYAFSECTSLTSIDFPNSVATLRAYLFRKCYNLQNVHIGAGVKSIEYRTFAQTGKLGFTVDSGNTNYIAVNGVLYDDTGTTLVKFAKDALMSDFIIPNGVTTIDKGAFMLCEDLESVVIPSSATQIGANAFTRCAKLSYIKSLALAAPSVDSTSFGSNNEEYVGVNSAGTNVLNVPFGSTGYEAGSWIDPLQNASKCGFTVHGKLIINSNRSNATFNIAYISEGDVNKTVTVGIGTFYINDVKYGTSMTITPNTLSGYTWEKAYETITYNGATTVTLNAYVYPSSATISGDSAIRGGNSATYTASISPDNVEVDVTYTWSISGSSNASISSSSGNSCTITTNSVEEEETCTLTCVVKSVDNKVTVQGTHNITVLTRPNFITATYNVTSTSSSTQLLYMTKYVTYMEVDGVEVTPVTTYTFTTTGTHSIKITASTAYTLFKGCTDLTKVDFSECDGSKMINFEGVFYNASNLTDIVWGECTFPNAENLHYCFYNAEMLTSVDFTPFAGAKITSIYTIFQGCSKLVSADFSGMDLSKVTSIQNMFNGCSALKSVKFSAFAKVTNANSAFCNCSSLTSIDLSPLGGCPITSIDSMCSGCTGLSGVLDLRPLQGSPIKTMSSAFRKTNITSINWDGCKFPNATSLSSLCLDCGSLTEIDLTPFKDCATIELGNMLRGCVKVSKITARWSTAPAVIAGSYVFGYSSSTYTGYSVKGSGGNTIYVPVNSTGYDANAWLDPLQNQDKCGFTLEYLYEPTECTSLSITADDVGGKATSTTIHYTATTNGVAEGEQVSGIVLTGNVESASFPQNTSTTDTVQREISFTYLGVTATTTITQGVWPNIYYTLDLNNGQWTLSSAVANPDTAVYDGVYQSVKSKGVNNGYDTMYIDIFDYTTFQLYIRSFAESNYDYVMVSQLDQTITGSTSYSNTTLVKAHTRGKSTGTTAISGYTLVEFTGIDTGEHRITVVYRKDSSGNSNDDRGYVLIPKNQ